MRGREEWPRKVEKLNLPKEVEEAVTQIVALAGNLDKESLKKIVDLNKKGHNLRFLERMVWLSRQADPKKLIGDWESYFPLYSLQEKTAIKRWRNRLSDNEEVRKSKKITEEIAEELEEVGINLKSNWDFGFRARQKQRKEKMLSEKEKLKEIFEKYNLPKAVEGEELIEFVYLPPDWKKRIQSDDFRKKTEDLGIKCDSLSQLIETYKKLESRKFRKKRKKISGSGVS